MTEYLVMQKALQPDATWNDLDKTDAPNARIAVKQAMKEYKLDEGTFRALPTRSAKTYTVKTEARPRTIWS